MITRAVFRTYCHATEEEARVRKAVRFVSCVQDKDIEVTLNKGYHGNEIRILEVDLKKGQGLNRFLSFFAENGVFGRIRDELRVRMDDEGMVFVRFDKQAAFLGNLVLDSGQDTIQVRFKVQAFPSKPDNLMAELEAQIEKLEAAAKRKRKD